MLNSHYALLVEALRVLFLVVVPVVLAVAMAGLIAGSLQAATTIQDVAIGYAARLGAAILVIYIFYPAFSRALINLAEMAFR